jgi:16S rRNA (uracil1498-N3)-methyltransferase
MRQFILPEDWRGEPSCLVEGGRARYLARVLRLEPGDSFPGRDSSGRLWECRVDEAGPGRILLSIAPPPEDGSADPPSEGGSPAPKGQGLELPRLILVQGLTQGAKMDLVIRQAAEAGVFAVLPLLASRALAKAEEGSRSRMARWERIVREARQQSGSAVRTAVSEPVGLGGLGAELDSLGVLPSDPRVLLHEAPLAQSSMHGYLTGAPETVVLCVGPEGGFARDEVDFLLQEGFKPLRLAGAILRAETAALYAIASAQIVLSERSSWIPKPP